MNRDTISTNQVMATVALAMIGVSILVAPGEVARVSGPGAWLSFLITGVASAGITALMVALCLRFRGETLVGFSKRILGGPMGIAVSIVFAVLETLSGVFVARLFAEAVGSVVLVRAPVEVLTGTMLLLTLYLAFQRVRVFGRVNEFFFPAVIGAFSVFILSMYGNVSLANLTPVLGGGAGAVFAGGLPAVVAFQGFEVMLYFLGFAEKPQESMRAALTGVAVVGTEYVATAAGVTAIFGHYHLGRLQWPVLEAVKLLGGESGRGAERLEALFVTVWMIAAFTSASAFTYTGVRAIAEITGLQHGNLIVPVAAPLMYVVALAPANIFGALSVTSTISILTVGWAALITLVMYAVAVIRGIRGDPGAGRGSQ